MIAMTCFAALFGAAFLICYANFLDVRNERDAALADLDRISEAAWRNAQEIARLKGRVLPRETVYDRLKDEWSA